MNERFYQLAPHSIRQYPISGIFWALTLLFCSNSFAWQGYSADFSMPSNQERSPTSVQTLPNQSNLPDQPVLPRTPDEESFTSPTARPTAEPLDGFESFRVRHSQPSGHVDHPISVPENGTDSIRLTDFNSPVDSNPRESQSPAQMAKELINRYSILESDEELPGKPITLLELMRSPIPTQRRAEMVNQYWETWMRWSRVQSSVRYLQWLDKSGQPSSSHESAVLQAAKAAVKSQIAAAKIDLYRAQMKLAEYLPEFSRSDNGGNVLLPLPADLPLVQSYTTRSEIYKQHRRLPTRLFNIDQVLDETMELIHSQAAVVQLGQSAANSMQAAFKSQQTNLGSLLEAGRIWRTGEESLITTVANYNRFIADYSMTVTDGSQSAEVATAMLIVRPKNNTQPPIKADSRNEVVSFEESPPTGFEPAPPSSQPPSESKQIRVPDQPNPWSRADFPAASPAQSNLAVEPRDSSFNTSSSPGRSTAEPGRMDEPFSRPQLPAIPRDSDFGRSPGIQNDPEVRPAAGGPGPFRPLPDHSEEMVRPILPPDDPTTTFSPPPAKQPDQKANSDQFRPFQ